MEDPKKEALLKEVLKELDDITKDVKASAAPVEAEKEDVDMKDQANGKTKKNKKQPKKPIDRKHRGYAFVEFEREQDMKTAYKNTDGIRIKDRKIAVDVERGRTVTGWRPMRFGGGKGGRGYTKEPISRPYGGQGGYGPVREL